MQICVLSENAAKMEKMISKQEKCEVLSEKKYGKDKRNNNIIIIISSLLQLWRLKCMNKGLIVMSEIKYLCKVTRNSGVACLLYTSP